MKTRSSLIVASHFRLAAIGFALIISVPANQAAGIVIRVDLGVADGQDDSGISPNEIQAGFDGMHPNQFVLAASTYDFTDANFSSTTFSGVLVNVGMTGGGQATARDYVGNVSGSLGDLLEDGVFAEGGILAIDLNNMPLGWYRMTTYHHSPEPFFPNNLFDIHVLMPAFGSSASSSELVAPSVYTTAGYAPESVSSATFDFEVNGSQRALILFAALGAPNYVEPLAMALNGFELTLVPEPSTWMLLATGLGALGAFRWRRRFPSRLQSNSH